MYTTDLFDSFAKDHLQHLLYEAEIERQLRAGKPSFRTRLFSKLSILSKQLEPKRLRNRYAA